MYTKQEEEQAHREYLQMVDALRGTPEFSNEWTGKWDDFMIQHFGKNPRRVAGDKKKFMKHWIENQKVINDTDWDKIETDNNDNEWLEY